MGSNSSKLSIADALQKLRGGQLPADGAELDRFWAQFWPDQQPLDPLELATQITPADLRLLRRQRPQHLAQLVLRCGWQLIRRSRHGLCNSVGPQTVVVNCARLLVRLLPYAYEDEDLAGLLWARSTEPPESPGPDAGASDADGTLPVQPLAIQLMDAVCDLLFCPDFTVAPNRTPKSRSRSKSSECQVGCETVRQKV